MHERADKALLRIIERDKAENNYPSDYYIGSEWWQISLAECEVFEIGPDEMGFLCNLWEAFLAFVGNTPSFFSHAVTNVKEREAEIKQAFDRLAAENSTLTAIRHSNEIDRDAFLTFARLLGCPPRKAFCLFAKMEMHDLRIGVITF